MFLTIQQGVPTKVRVFSLFLPPFTSHPDTPKSARQTAIIRNSQSTNEDDIPLAEIKNIDTMDTFNKKENKLAAVFLQRRQARSIGKNRQTYHSHPNRAIYYQPWHLGESVHYHGYISIQVLFHVIYRWCVFHKKVSPFFLYCPPFVYDDTPSLQIECNKAKSLYSST